MSQSGRQFTMIPTTEDLNGYVHETTPPKLPQPSIKICAIAILTLILLTLCLFSIQLIQEQRQRINDAEYYQFVEEQNTRAILNIQKEIAELTLFLQKPPKEVLYNVTKKISRQRKKIQAAQQDKFIIPKIVWLYLNATEDSETEVVRRNIANIKHYAQLSGFQVKILDKINYGQYLPQAVSSELTNLIADLQKKRQNDEELNLKFQKVRQTLIELHVLRQSGGVAISKYYLLTETLQWLQDIKANRLINIGNPGGKPSYFAFFANQQGPGPVKQNRKVQNEVDKYMIVSPGVKDCFLAGVPGGQYLQQLLPKYIELVSNSQSLYWTAFWNGIYYEKFNSSNLNNALILASHMVVFAKQKQLDSIGQLFGNTYKKFAIDEYGLVTMNSNYFADKIQYYFNNRLPKYDNYYNYLAKLPLDEFEDSIGPLRYIANPDPFGQFNSRILSALKKQGNYTIVEGSFIHKYLFLGQKKDFITQNKEKRNQFSTFKKWTTFPKILWLYWDKGFDNIPVFLQITLKYLIKKAESSGYEVIKVSDANAHRYIPPQTLNRMQTIIDSKKMKIFPPTKSDFHRLALVSTHGGVYLDCSFIFLQDFKWIEQIANEQTQHIFNRFGEVPKVLMQFHPIEGGPFDWKVNDKYNTKAHWHLAFESNFLVADKDSEFIKDWFEQFLWFTNSTYEQTELRMKKCGMFSHKWTLPGDRYLTVMDSLKAVMGCKQIEIDNNREKFGSIADAADYYKMWAINGFTGFQKCRYYNNYANYGPYHGQDNYLIYRFSREYAQEIHGPIYKAIKFYGMNKADLNEFIEEKKDKLASETHPESIFVKYVLNQPNPSQSSVKV